MDATEVKVFMVGLDNAGKTKLLYTLMNGSCDETVRTTGYNVETMEHNGIKYTIWEIGGHKTVRIFRHMYTEGTSAIIYVIDVADVERFDEAQTDLNELMHRSELTDAVLLIVANKMDLVPDFDVESLANHLNLPGLKQKWRIYGVSATEGGSKLHKIFDILEGMLNRLEGDD